MSGIFAATGFPTASLSICCDSICCDVAAGRPGGSLLQRSWGRCREATDGVWADAPTLGRIARPLQPLGADGVLLSTPHPSPSATPSPLRGEGGGARRLRPASVTTAAPSPPPRSSSRRARGGPEPERCRKGFAPPSRDAPAYRGESASSSVLMVCAMMPFTPLTLTRLSLNRV